VAVSNACYCTREEVQRALDIKPTQIDALRVDRALETARDDIEALTHRRFYNVLETRFVDWPNYDYAYPWRVWLDAAELADITSTVPVVTTGTEVIPADNLFWGNPKYPYPPFNYVEINRSTNSSFGVSTTPQRDISILGVFGYWNRTTAAGNLAAAITDTTGTSVTVTNSNSPGVGDVMIVNSESLLVTDRNWVTTSQTQSSGCTTASNSDNSLTVSGGTFFAGETLLLDAEQMLVTSVNGSVLTVKRAWNGTVLATHSGATIYAGRLLSVGRGFGGTTAATHSNNAAVTIATIPGSVKSLAIAEALNIIQQETSGYARQVGEPGAAIPATGGSIPDLRDQVYQRYGRKVRRRVI